MGKVASVRISQRSDPNDVIDDANVKHRKALTPEQSLYGIYAPQYANVLTTSADGKLGETARIGDRIALHNAADDEARRYSQDLAAANAAQQRISDTEGYYGILGDTQKYEQGDVDRGMGGARRVVAGPDGHYRIQIDPVKEQVANANSLNNDQATRYGVYSHGIAEQRGVGLNQPDSQYGKLLTPPTQAEPVVIHSGTAPLTPQDQTNRYAADEGLTAEQQVEIEQVKAAAREKGDELSVEVKQPTTNGPPEVTYKGTPDVLMRNGIDPNTGKKLNPNAGAQGGGASATPAAKNDPTIKPVANAAQVASNLFPGITITDNKRDPNSKLGKENPNSYHVRTGAAIDVKPVDGMTFEQYKKRYEDAGYPVIEAIDEVKHPSKHATGPHWHIVLGERRDTSQMYASRFKTSPLVADATPIGDGTVLVKLKDGTQRVYKNGRRVG